MSQNSTEPQWPVIIHYANDPELDLVTSPEEWLKREDIQQLNFQPGDKIIDSNGRFFELPVDKGDQGTLVYNDEQIDLESLLGLIKAHMSEKGACCVAKLYAPTIAEAFKILVASDSE